MATFLSSGLLGNFKPRLPQRGGARPIARRTLSMERLEARSMLSTVAMTETSVPAETSSPSNPILSTTLVSIAPTPANDPATTLLNLMPTLTPAITFANPPTTLYTPATVWGTVTPKVLWISETEAHLTSRADIPPGNAVTVAGKDIKPGGVLGVTEVFVRDNPTAAWSRSQLQVTYIHTHIVSTLTSVKATTDYEITTTVFGNKTMKAGVKGNKVIDDVAGTIASVEVNQQKVNGPHATTKVTDSAESTEWNGFSNTPSKKKTSSVVTTSVKLGTQNLVLKTVAESDTTTPYETSTIVKVDNSKTETTTNQIVSKGTSPTTYEAVVKETKNYRLQTKYSATTTFLLSTWSLDKSYSSSGKLTKTEAGTLGMAGAILVIKNATIYHDAAYATYAVNAAPVIFVPDLDNMTALDKVNFKVVKDFVAKVEAEVVADPVTF